MLPRASLALAGGGLLLGAGLVAGSRSLGHLRLPALAVGLAAVAAGLLTTAPALTLVGAYGRYESLPMRLAYLGLFCGAAWLGERRRTVAAFLLGCGVAAAEALYQAAAHVHFRPDGNLGNANLLGALLAMALPLAADRARTATPTARRAWLALGALLVAGLVASTSRSGWLGALAGLCVLAACLVPLRRLWIPLVAGAVALGLAFALIALTPLRGLNDDTGEARLGIWHDSLSVVGARPVLGWGEDTMALVFGRHQTADWAPGHNFDRAHSMPLDLGASQGLVGLAACTWLLGAWWLGVWRRRDLPGIAGLAGAAAAYLVWSLVNFDWAPATAAFWLLAGAAASLPPPSRGTVAAHSSPPPLRGRVRVGGTDRSAHTEPGADPAQVPGSGPPHPGPPPPRGRGARASGPLHPRWLAAAGAVLLGLVVAVPPQLADVFSYLGQPDRAAALDPLQPTYHAELGGLAGLRRAAELGDPSPSTYVALGDAEARDGGPAAAAAAYRRALELYPFDQAARQRLAASRLSGRPRAASG